MASRWGRVVHGGDLGPGGILVSRCRHSPPRGLPDAYGKSVDIPRRGGYDR
jgi:hypothetical protein